MKKTKLFLGITLCTMLLFMATSCGTRVNMQERVTLKMGTTKLTSEIETIVSDFNKTQSDYAVEIVDYSSADGMASQNLIHALKGETPPDLFLVTYPVDPEISKYCAEPEAYTTADGEMLCEMLPSVDAALRRRI